MEGLGGLGGFKPASYAQTLYNKASTHDRSNQGEFSGKQPET